MSDKLKRKAIVVERLKEVRKHLGLTQQGMYEAMECSQASYSNYENVDNPSLPSAEMLLNLNAKYNIPIDWILGVDSKKNESKAKTVSDILECLFVIGDSLNIKVHTIAEVRYELMGVNYPDGYTTDRHGIFFNEHESLDDYLDSFIKEWGEIKEFCKGKDIGKTMYDLWKKDKIEKNKNKTLASFKNVKIGGGFMHLPDGIEDEGLPFN